MQPVGRGVNEKENKVITCTPASHLASPSRPFPLSLASWLLKREKKQGGLLFMNRLNILREDYFQVKSASGLMRCSFLYR